MIRVRQHLELERGAFAATLDLLQAIDSVDDGCAVDREQQAVAVCGEQAPADRDADGVSKFGSQTPMKRPAQPEEIAPAFVFLAAPSCSSYITGEILPIIGGYSGG